MNKISNALISKESIKTVLKGTSKTKKDFFLYTITGSNNDLENMYRSIKAILPLDTEYVANFDFFQFNDDNIYYFLTALIPKKKNPKEELPFPLRENIITYKENILLDSSELEKILKTYELKFIPENVHTINELIWVRTENKTLTLGVDNLNLTVIEYSKKPTTPYDFKKVMTYKLPEKKLLTCY